MNTLFQISVLCITMLLTSCVVTAQQTPRFTLPEPNPFKKLLPANYCEVINNPESYDGRLIRLRVIWYQMIEGATLFSYDSECWHAMRPVFDCPTDADCKPLLDRIYQNFGPRRFDVSAGMLLNGRLRYRRFVTRTDVRHGRSHYDFEVVDFEESLKLPSKPNEKGWPPEFLLRTNGSLERE